MSIITDLSDINKITECGKRLHQIKQKLIEEIKINTTPLQIENLAQKLIKEAGGTPSFMTVEEYKYATCIAVNDEVVHGIPDNEPFKQGDVVGLDIGLFYKGWHTDTSETKFLKSQALSTKKQSEIEKFVEIGELALKKAIEKAKAGNRIGHISQAIGDMIEGAGYSIVKTLVGHGIGKKLHEAPQIPGILNKPIEKTPQIVPGMALAIEVIYNMGKPEIIYKNNDGWTLATKDGSLSGLFEETVLVTKDGNFVLT